MFKAQILQPLKQSQPIIGIVFLITGGFIFSIQDVIIKFISGDYPVHEIVFLRSLFAILPILAIVRLEGGLHLLKIKNFYFHIVRGILMFLCYTSYYLAIAVIPLSHTVTLFFCCPLFITLLSVIFLKERIDKKGWTAIFVGFCGIIVVMRPDMAAQNSVVVSSKDIINTSSLNYGYMLALFSGLFYAINAVCTRKYGVYESGASLVFYPIFTYLLFSGIVWAAIGDGRFATDENKNMEFLLRNWSFPENRDIFLICLVGFIAATGTYCLTQAYRLSDASVVAPFEYFVIPITVFWGYLFWKEVPGEMQLIGIIMIIASGVYVLKRNSKRVVLNM